MISEVLTVSRLVPWLLTLDVIVADFSVGLNDILSDLKLKGRSATLTYQHEK